MSLQRIALVIALVFVVAAVAQEAAKVKAAPQPVQNAVHPPAHNGHKQPAPAAHKPVVHQPAVRRAAAHQKPPIPRPASIVKKKPQVKRMAKPEPVKRAQAVQHPKSPQQQQQQPKQQVKKTVNKKTVQKTFAKKNSKKATHENPLAKEFQLIRKEFPELARSLDKLMKKPKKGKKSKKGAATSTGTAAGTGSSAPKSNKGAATVSSSQCPADRQKSALVAVLLGVFLGFVGFDRFYYMYYWQGGLKFALGLLTIIVWRANIRAAKALAQKNTQTSSSNGQPAKPAKPSRARSLVFGLLALGLVAWIGADIAMEATGSLLPANGCPVKPL